MKRLFLVSLATLATTVALIPDAVAGSCCYGYRVRYYRVHPHYHVMRRAPSPPRWALGLHFTGLGTDQMINDEAMALGGLGGHLRYRGFRWGVELAADVVGGEFVEGKIKRLSVPLQASALLYLIPEGVFNLYLIGGARVIPTRIEWDYPNLQDKQNFVELGFHGGLGADLNLGRWFALTADFRLFGVMRGDSNPAGEYYAEVDHGILPSDSTGLQVNLGCSIRF